jgi:hypothetical protein
MIIISVFSVDVVAQFYAHAVLHWTEIPANPTDDPISVVRPDVT